MKKKFIYLLIAVTGILSSCEDFIDRAPVSDLAPATFFQSKGDMKSWTSGMYDAFQRTLNDRHLFWGDLRSDSYEQRGNYGDSRYFMNAIESSMGEYSWGNLYKTIYSANVAIEKFPEIPGTIQGDWSDYVGQAYGMRALMYFYAIRTWGDVPIDTIPWNGNVQLSYVPRSPVLEVKKLILSDLDNAIKYLNSDVTRKYYFNLSAAWALKMDVHMWFNEYQEALTVYDNYFGKISSYALVKNEAEWKKMFLAPTESSETIFNMAWNYEQDGAHPWAQRVGASNTNNMFSISQVLFGKLIDRLYTGYGKDGRFWNMIDTVKLWNQQKAAMSITHYSYNDESNSIVSKCVKYSDVDPTATTSRWLVLSTSNADIDISIYRYADVLLLRAEALNQVGKPTEALNIVNDIRKRVGYLKDAKTEVVDINDKKAVETIILEERQIEFFAEGKRWFDLVRTGRVIEVMDPVLRARQFEAGVPETGFGDPGRILFPIYYREFESNPALIGHQNPPYTEG